MASLPALGDCDPLPLVAACIPSSYQCPGLSLSCHSVLRTNRLGLGKQKLITEAHCKHMTKGGKEQGTMVSHQIIFREGLAVGRMF